MTRFVVAGAGLAAARACATLRRKGFDGELVVLGAEHHAPYDRPPLSKAVLRGDRDDAPLPFDVDTLGVRFRAGVTATGLNVAERVVRTDDGDEPFDGLLLATGAEPVRLPGSGEQLTVRTLDDAYTLRSRLRPGARVVVIGASWIGAEVATAALAAGCRVTCLEAGPAPLSAALGGEVGALFTPWWSDVDLRLDTKVASVDPGGVQLADGAVVTADVVVTGVGVRPATGWLAGSGLEIGNGVHVDEYLRTSAPGVFAVGDLAARWSPRLGARLRVEHWDEAGAAATVAAQVLLACAAGTPEADLPVHDPVPYFWSDQFGRKIQHVGRHGPADRAEVDTSDTARPAVRWYSPDGGLTAWLGVDRVKELVPARKQIADTLVALS
ncbi:NADPH-dependent 2,4-dienoyl-CoA reductase/sulfur reductase-like enzyme [Prauserella sediminis]|uniref:NADPH-dependent 2,4-dienoyl-CoA reductase/sulfur reductase-like enzyme n=1 Tax=Prauserella sediminis TaxID=577680 RepID=A0A839XVU2_9PSEU|nr:FAD-dependent oxidoreductase [Prauserella sediminis]MBB3665178.1 NADPH-dependent 2,4-dienoyl-CoA reductase/sulfur reductase-like enzyme [Prauserella sediminis]